MRSDLPKVVHPVGGRPMVCAVVEACRAAGCARIVVVVGYKQELVRAALEGVTTAAGAPVEFAVQSEQLGTGHAVMCAAGEGDPAARYGREVLVLCGDGPLIRPATLATILERHRETGAAATLATSIIDDPAGYGRIVRDAQGRFVAIVEHKDATGPQQRIREINPSYYCFEPAALFGALRRVERNPANGEYYLTHAPSLLLAEGRRIEVIPAVPPEDVLSINTPEELAAVDRIYRGRAPGAVGTPA